MRNLVFSILLIALPCSAFGQINDVEDLPATVFYSIAFRGDTVLAGAAGTVYVSSDRGHTWRSTSRVPDAASVDAVVATDAGWFVGCINAGVYRSLDEGASWTHLSSGLTGLGALDITDFELYRDHLYASTDGAGVFALDLTSPSAWQRFGSEFAANEASTVVSLALFEGHLIAAAGGNGLILTRDLNEDFWVPVQAAPLQLLSVARTGAGLFTSSRRSAFRSDDNGDTWYATGALPSGISSTLATSGDENDRDAFIAVVTGAGVSQLFRLSHTTNGWEWIAEVAETLKMITYDGRLYLATTDGLKALALDPGTGAPPTLPVETGLSVQLPVPHPVVDDAEVGFSLEAGGAVRLEVFDALGRLVTVLYDGLAVSGKSSIRFDSRGLASGVYAARAVSGRAIAVQTFVVAR